jgi:hypothetical protein
MLPGLRPSPRLKPRGPVVQHRQAREPPASGHSAQKGDTIPEVLTLREASIAGSDAEI